VLTVCALIATEKQRRKEKTTLFGVNFMRSQVLYWTAQTATDVKCDRSQDSQAMADRITDEVNSILCQEDGAPQLSKQAVLDLIDQGASQGGSQAGCNKSLHLNCCSSLLAVFL